jgi:phosphotransacetylase
MTTPPRSLQELIGRAKSAGPIRVAVADAVQDLVVETMREARELAWIEPRLIGEPDAIRRVAREAGWQIADDWIVSAESGSAAAAKAVTLVQDGQADAVMKGHLHTDVLMHALLDKEHGLRMPGRRVSHVFVVDVPSHPKLLGVTDAAINIAPDLNAKADILQNAVELFTLIGVERPKVAVLSAVETVNPAIVSTLDAACLTLMARRGQLHGAIVDGPLAFDNAISAAAAKEKGIVSDVAGDADILLVPDLVSGNILAKLDFGQFWRRRMHGNPQNTGTAEFLMDPGRLRDHRKIPAGMRKPRKNRHFRLAQIGQSQAKDLEYLARAVAAGVVVGLAAPVVLTSRADPPAARLASLALGVLMFRGRPKLPQKPSSPVPHPHLAPQPDHACCPLPG